LEPDRHLADCLWVDGRCVLTYLELGRLRTCLTNVCSRTQQSRAADVSVRSTMSLRCTIARIALCLAHRAMALESIQRTQALPKFYLKADVYSQDFENEGRSYIFIDGDLYTYWFDQGDHGPWWTGRTGNGLEELIRIYYTGKIEGKTAMFPSQFACRKFGSIMKFALEGRAQEWWSKHKKIEDELSVNLNRYLRSPAFKCLEYLARPGR
jgi:hypothetical protein